MTETDAVLETATDTADAPPPPPPPETGLSDAAPDEPFDFAAALAAAIRALVAAVDFDMNGQQGRGGNGGLLSNETLRASDEARLVLNFYEKSVKNHG